MLERDLILLKDAVMKYFVYQTSFIKNTEYDANNIIETIKEERRNTITSLPEEKLKVKKIFLLASFRFSFKTRS